MSDAKLLQRLNDELAPRANELEKDNDAQKPAMSNVIAALSDAIRARDQPLIRRFAKLLEEQVSVYAGLVNRANKLLDELGRINSDDRDALKRVEALKRKASDAQRKIVSNYEKLKGFQDMAHKAGDPAATAAMAEWAEMESWMTTQREVALIHVKQMEALVELADSAVKDGDAESLAQAQEKAKLRLKWPTAGDMVMRFTALCAKCETALAKDLQEQFKRDRAKFQRMLTEIAGLNDKMDAHFAKLKNMKMPAAKSAKLDVRKAAVVLGVAEAKLKKAWDAGANAPEKALEGLAKELKLRTSGKDMVLSLRKAKLLV